MTTAHAIGALGLAPSPPTALGLGLRLCCKVLFRRRDQGLGGVAQLAGMRKTLRV